MDLRIKPNEIPSGYSWARLDSPLLAECVKPPLAIDLARELLWEQRVTITGPTGVGKSVLAAAMVQEGGDFLWVAFHELRYLDWSDPRGIQQRLAAPLTLVLDGLEKLPLPNRDSYGEDDEYEEYVYREYREKLLSEYEPFASGLEAVAHARLASARRTIITTCERDRVIEESYSLFVSRWVFGCKLIRLDPEYDYTKDLGRKRRNLSDREDDDGEF